MLDFDLNNDSKVRVTKVTIFEEELELYRKAGVEVAARETLTSNPLRVAEIKRLKGEFGMPIEITQEFVDSNPGLMKVLSQGAGTPEVGSIVFATEASIEEAKQLDQEATLRTSVLEKLAALNVPLDEIDVPATTTEELQAILGRAEEASKENAGGTNGDDADKHKALVSELLERGVTLSFESYTVAQLKEVLDAWGSRSVVQSPVQGSHKTADEYVYTDPNGSTFTVVSTINALQAGRRFKDVVLSDGTTHRMTEAEYEKRVTKRV